MHEDFDKAAQRLEGERQRLLAGLTPEQRVAYDKLMREQQKARDKLLKEQAARKGKAIRDKIRELRRRRKHAYTPKGAKPPKTDLAPEAKHTIEHNDSVERNQADKALLDDEISFLQDCEKERSLVAEPKAEYKPQSRKERLEEIFRQVSQKRDTQNENERGDDDHTR